MSRSYDEFDEEDEAEPFNGIVSLEVQNAAKILDEVIPGWHWRVDTGRLEMGDCKMCMLGQTFGLNAELSIAKELYPKEWEEARQKDIGKHGGGFSGYESDGYSIGREFFKARSESHQVPVSLEEACSGDHNNCEWISEIADRRAKDVEAGKEPKESKRTSKRPILRSSK